MNNKTNTTMEINKTTNAMLAKALNTDWGTEELRRSIISGLLRMAEKDNDDRQILAQVVLDKKIFGDIPEEWESNPYGWSFHLQYEQ